MYRKLRSDGAGAFGACPVALSGESVVQQATRQIAERTRWMVDADHHDSIGFYHLEYAIYEPGYQHAPDTGQDFQPKTWKLQ